MQDELRKIMLENIYSDPFSKYLGLEFLELDEKHALARIPFKDELKNPYKTMHGGVLYSLADIVAGTVSCMSGYFGVTVSGSFNYMQPGSGKEYLYCKADVVRDGAHLVVMDVAITNDEDKLIDKGTFTFFKTERKVLER